MATRQITRRIVISVAFSIGLIFFLFIRPQGPPSPAIRAPGHIDHSAPATGPPPAVHVEDGTLKGDVVMPKLGNATAKAELGRAAWKYFHTVMARFPEKPTQDQQDALRSYIYLFARLYPCGECASHFQQHITKYPPQVSSRKSAAGWLCFIHNEVNAMLDKPEFDCANLGDFYDCGCADKEEGDSKSGGGKSGEGKSGESKSGESKVGEGKDGQSTLPRSGGADGKSHDKHAVEISKEETTRG
ncbi:hypothetical protein NUU61_006898 [Penicillium alfredii]|uniref:Sulfhydryl oxidase n=1 Tax=Penicillium alfredii TaxID=1506179 RepID=A0A9W9F1R0_9EURO|nr:uncharacterized protein NUU61_006898 [Penicillium alfredii]KAJ5092028.1 hypothetical protein NUU61_006898 [Penicillium alfredii]